MLTTTAVFIRHGHVKRPLDSSGREVIYDHAAPLSELGGEEISDLAPFFDDLRFDVLHTSTTLRGDASMRRFVRGLKRKPGEVVLNHNLRTIDCPGWAGKLVKGSTGKNNFYRFNRPGDELPEDFARRIWNEITQALETNPGGTIGFVGHSEVIGLAMHNFRIIHKLPDPRKPKLYIEGPIPTGSAIRLELNPATLALVSETRIPEARHSGIEAPWGSPGMRK